MTVVRNSRILVMLGLLLSVLICANISAADQPTVKALLVGGLDHQVVWEALIPKFEAKTGVKVQWSSLPREQLILRATTLGQAKSDEYDIYSTHFSDVPQFHIFLDPLQGYFKTELKDFAESSLEGATIKGNLYQIPRYFDARMLFYRTDLFKQAGLKPPTNWKELLSAAQKLNNSTTGVWGFIPPGKGNPLMRHFSDFLWQNGGDFFDAKMNPIFNNDKGLESLQFIVDMIYKHKVSPPSSISFGWTECRTLFSQGGGAMYYEWPSGPPFLDDAKRSAVAGKYSFAPIPKNKTAINTSVTHGFGINKYSKQKQLAIQFIKEITSTEFQINEYKVRGTLPARKSAAKEVINTASGIEKERLLALEGTVKAGRSWPAIPEMAQIERTIYDELEKAVSQQKTPKQALDDAAARVRDILNKAGYYK